MLKGCSLNLSVTRVTKKATYSSDDDQPVEIVNKPKVSVVPFPTTSNESTPGSLSETTEGPDSKMLGKRKVNSRKFAEETGEGTDASSTDTDDEKQLKKRTKAASGARRAKILLSQREQRLRDDHWIHKVESSCVKCGGCFHWIQLNKDREFCPANWLQHKNKCPQIKGQANVRVAVQMQGVCNAPSLAPVIHKANVPVGRW